MSGAKKYTFGKVWQVTATEMCELLAGYDIDQIQELVKQKVIPRDLYKEIRGYLIGRMHGELKK